jgi:glucose-1-phosphate adenylyltransferase
VLTQYKAQSLIHHVDRGWGFLAASLGEYIDEMLGQRIHSNL